MMNVTIKMYNTGVIGCLPILIDFSFFTLEHEIMTSSQSRNAAAKHVNMMSLWQAF